MLLASVPQLVEPLTTAIIRWTCANQRPRWASLVCLLCAVVGVAFFIASAGDWFQYLGIVLAFSANVFMGFRELHLRPADMDLQDNASLPKASFYHKCVAVLVTAVSLSFLYKFSQEGSKLQDVASLLALGLFSAVCFSAFWFASNCRLRSQLSAKAQASITHVSLTLAAVVLCLLGLRFNPHCSFLGLLMALLNLLVYTFGEPTPAQSVRTDKDHSIDSHSSAGVSKLVWVAVIVLNVVLTVLLVNGVHLLQDSFHLRIDFTPHGNRLSTHGATQSYTDGRARTFASQTFYHDAFARPSEQSLLPDLNLFPESERAKVTWFLKQRLVKMPTEANYVIKQLRQSNDIIREGQRLHFNILADLVRPYKYALWIDISAITNKGDSGVTAAETYFLQRMNIKVLYYCHTQVCNRDSTMKKARQLALNYSPKDLVIIGHGGGNLLGYKDTDNVRFRIIRYFKEYQKVVFPQGIWIPQGNETTPHIKRARKAYCCVPNLTIVLRERPSYDIAKRLFHGSTRLLMSPDIVFQIGPVGRLISPVFDVLWLKRHDREDPGQFELPTHPDNVTVHVSEWRFWKTNNAGSQLEQAHYNNANGHLYLQRGRVLITDRLHGHVFAILNDMPHVLVDPLGSKLTNFHHTWTASLENTRVARDNEEAMRLALGLLEEYKDSLPALLPYLKMREDFEPYGPVETYV